MSLGFGLFGVCFHPRQELRFGGAFAKGRLLGPIGIMLCVAGLALGTFWRACGFVIHVGAPIWGRSS